MEYNNLDVFVLTYNRAKYLEIMLDSLCTQTAKGFNIVVLNNSSTDNTVEVVEKIKKLYPNQSIEIITNEQNLGNAGNFIRSQELAKNKYTAIFHDDDVIHPEYLETAMRIFSDNENIGAVTGGALALWNTDNTDWGMLHKDYFIYDKEKCVFFNLLIQRPIFASMIYKTEYYKQVKYHPEKYGKLHDIIFLLEINKLVSVACIQGCCIKWRQSAINDSNDLSNGPFLSDVVNVIYKMKKLNNNVGFLFNYLLFEFAIFLYKWSYLKRFLTKEKYLEELIKSGVFTKFECAFYSIKLINKINRKFSKIRAKYYRRKINNSYSGRSF